MAESAEMNFDIPASMLEREEYKRKFNITDLYSAFVFVPRAVLALAGNTHRHLIDRHFLERIMLAVTEVNGCAACSWAHTRMALSQGMSSEEIESLLNGDSRFIKVEEAKAILFAQHYADKKGFPGQGAFRAIVDEYGVKRARTILSAAQVMHAGNIYGIAYSALQARRKGKPYRDSSLAYELFIQIAGVLIVPFAIVHALVRWLIGKPNIRTDTKNVDSKTR